MEELNMFTIDFIMNVLNCSREKAQEIIDYGTKKAIAQHNYQNQKQKGK
jgi:hypothetical protein